MRQFDAADYARNMPGDDFVESEAFITALREAGTIPDSATYVWISAGGDEFMRLGYRHEEEGEPVTTTGRMFTVTAREIAKLLDSLAR